MKHKSILEVADKHLLDDYQAGDFFLASPHGTLLAEGVLARVPAQEKGNNQLLNLSERVAAVLDKGRQAGHSKPMIVGAVPFDYIKPVQLVVPRKIRRSGPLRFEYADPEQTSQTPAYEIQPVPEPSEYILGVNRGLADIKAGHFSKIVLSRSLHLTSSNKVDIHQLLHNLARHNVQGYTFAVDLPEREAGDNSSAATGKRTLIGSSPELLVSKLGLQVRANPLAGSRPRSKDPEEDRKRATELLASVKDRHEHAVVVEDVVASLRPYCRTLDVPAEPSLIHTETMWHLSTEIKGELSDPATTSLELAIALHPTPAVCGYPTDAAREAIKEIEPFERGFFTGVIGWCDADGDGEWVVTIRCAEADDYSLRLYAGAGIVTGSKAESELAETSAKFRTMLLAMGLDND
ncbi:MAG: isochorismate synthase DhbC [Thermoactinomyces sp.]